MVKIGLKFEVRTNVKNREKYLHYSYAFVSSMTLRYNH